MANLEKVLFGCYYEPGRSVMMRGQKGLGRVAFLIIIGSACEYNVVC